MQDNNAKVAPGMYVELGYDLYEIAPDGTQVTVHQTDADDPERIIFGVTEGVLEPLEKALDGLKVGEAFDVTVTSEKAFGAYDKEKVIDLDREIFVVDGKFDSETVKVGAAVPMMTSEGYRIMGRVLNISGDKVTMDFNHPLAGAMCVSAAKCSLCAPLPRKSYIPYITVAAAAVTTVTTTAAAVTTIAVAATAATATPATNFVMPLASISLLGAAILGVICRIPRIPMTLCAE